MAEARYNNSKSKDCVGAAAGDVVTKSQAVHGTVEAPGCESGRYE